MASQTNTETTPVPTQNLKSMVFQLDRDLLKMSTTGAMIHSIAQLRHILLTSFQLFEKGVLKKNDLEKTISLVRADLLKIYKQRFHKGKQ